MVPFQLHYPKIQQSNGKFVQKGFIAKEDANPKNSKDEGVLLFDVNGDGNDSDKGIIKFTEVTKEVAPDLINIGMVFDALFTDFDNDGRVDITLA